VTTLQVAATAKNTAITTDNVRIKGIRVTVASISQHTIKISIVSSVM
jgi:hypothetical protein